ncbi:alpha/beta fold hydrolase [Bosea sp. PAMC 26642]|uniref:alpha/beta fold hydrolase n=1 Tax=Bosea sp. (strain PAMC 26642) TaxID=1792307 RepID=UPI0007702F05|nr:alpha/beta fold hydrolase [Bosea sp. PAMC 26642]AMJ62441.1 alpha/beta hydrolase [Bosea sp. PAMC 26642]
MIEDPLGAIDYDEAGEGPTLVLVPGSCSTGAAWRPVVRALGGHFRTVTTSLPGYGGSAERRTADDTSIGHVAGAVERVIERAGQQIHLVGHSFGGLTGLAVALRRRVTLASLTILEAPAPSILPACGEDEFYRMFRTMTDAYRASFMDGDECAIAAMIDFYGGRGTWVSWPERVRAYAVATTPVNLRDWESAYALALNRAFLAELKLPVLVCYGTLSHPSVRRANALIGESVGWGRTRAIEGASHFMISTHPGEIAAVIAAHVSGA